MQIQKSFYEVSHNELKKVFSIAGINPENASLLYHHYHKEKNLSFCHHHNLAASAKKLIAEEFHFTLPNIVQIQISEDQTTKFLFELTDGLKVECVLIPFHKKYALCISTQVGCAMNCSFCFTGTMGLKRHLKSFEITGQFIKVWNWMKDNGLHFHLLKNIVYMGQGEPLHNFEAVRDANKIFVEHFGMGLGVQKITVSTAGYLPGLKRWISEMPGVNLALSLHSPIDEKRNILIPINRAYPLHQIMEVIDQIPLARKQFITYEYLLIANFNDSVEDAQATGEFLKNRRAIVNLIAFNPFPNSRFERPSEESVARFKKIIESYNVPIFVRTTKGSDILAACGQLVS